MSSNYPAHQSPLNLGPGQRAAIRSKIMDACMVAYHHAGIMQYSEGSNRWSGIAEDKRAYKNEYPPFADCSSSGAWVYWDATRAEKLVDFVNGLGWRAGNTTSMVRCGQNVNRNELLRGDAVFYGGSRTEPEHLAIYIGNNRVFSHGSPGGPRILSIDYRTDINQFKRYIR